MMELITNFIDLNWINVMYLFFVGFVGGLVSGFIGSGGAFVLTPGMMSMGVPGLVAVASNMCHKFPKALVGAIKRAKFGQVDVKLGLVMGASAEAGVLVGAHIQEHIKKTFGDAGSNLYVSMAFVVVLGIVGTYVLLDAMKTKNNELTNKPETVTKIAKWVQSIHIPGTMVYFRSLGTKVSVLFTVPLGFATGMLAATIAVGGFIGVPAMIYILGAPALMASATELVIAFVMGLVGSLKYAMGGFVDIRLSMIILAGSLFGVQLGAIGTTYVKDYMIKIVMGVIMLLVLVSRGLMVPVYLSQLGIISSLSNNMITVLKTTSFVIMIGALLTGALIISVALIKGLKEEKRIQRAVEVSSLISKI
uniref:Probable membrane transporter protein n=1 Tax=Thermodesulfovibrio aggregans TaxID=86166 RepID=A0A7C4EMF8_9BACT